MKIKNAPRLFLLSLFSLTFFLARCSSEPAGHKNWFYDVPVGDDTTLPEFRVGSLKFQNTWVPNNAHAGMEFESYFTLVSENTPNFNVYVKQTLVKLSTGALSELDGQDLGSLVKDTEKLSDKTVVPLSGLLIENIQANSPQTYHLKPNDDTYYKLPSDLADGTYAVIFSTNEISVDSSGQHQGEVDEDDLANTSFHAPATVIVGTPDKPNIRILSANLSNNSFTINQQKRERSISAGSGYAQGESPDLVLNLEIEAMALDVTDTVETTFQLGVPDYTGNIQWHNLKIADPVTDPVSPTFSYRENLVLFPNPETGVTLVNEEPSGHTVSLYLENDIKSELANYPFDKDCKLRIKVDPDNDIDEWSAAGAPNKTDNTQILNVKYLSRFIDPDKNPINRSQVTDISDRLSQTMLGTSKKKSKNKNSSDNEDEKEESNTEIDISEQLKDPWGSAVGFVTRPPAKPWLEYDTVYPEEAFDVSKSEVAGKKDLLAAGYQFKAHLYYQNFHLKNYEIPAAAKFGTYNWIKAWIFSNELLLLGAQAQMDLTGFAFTSSYFQYDTHLLNVKIFAQNYAFEDDCEEGCELWNTQDDEGNEKLAKEVEKTKEKYFVVAGIPLKVEAGITGTGGLKGSVDVEKPAKFSVSVGPFLNISGVAEGSVSIGIVSAGVGIELTILDIYQKFSPYISLDLKPGWQVTSTVEIGLEAPLEIKTLDGRLYAFVELEFLFYSDKFEVTFFKWDGLEWEIEWLPEIKTSWSVTTIPEPEMIAHFPLDDVSSCNTNGCKVDDVSHNDYKGRIAATSGNSLGTTTDRFGRSGRAAYFGGDDKVLLDELTSEYTQLNRYGFSLSLWIKKKNTGHEMIIGRGNSGWERVGLATDGFYAAGTNHSTQGYIFQPTTTTTDRWHHLVVSANFFDANEDLTADSPTRHRVYLDGELVQDGIFTVPDNCCSVDWAIGKYANIDSNAFEGAVDDVRIFNYGVSESEVAALYNEGGWGTNGGYDNVVFAPFDETYAVNDYFFNNTVDIHDTTEKVDRDNPDEFVYTFNGGDYVETTGPIGGEDKNSFSAYTWVYFSQTMVDQSYLSRFWQIMGKNFDGNDTLVGLYIKNKKIYLRWQASSSGTVHLINTGTQVQAGKMYHVGVTFERSGSNTVARLYLNGGLEQSKTTGLLTAYSDDYDVYSIFGESKFSTWITSNADFFTFLINDPKIINHTLSGDAIREVYEKRQNRGNFMDSLVAYYPFNGTTDDDSGYNYHIEEGNAGTYTYDRFGNPNSAMYFDGSGNYLKPPFDINIKGGRQFAVAFWFKPDIDPANNLERQGLINILGNGNNIGAQVYHFSHNYYPAVGFDWQTSPTDESTEFTRSLTTTYRAKNWYHVYAAVQIIDNALVGNFSVDGINLSTKTVNLTGDLADYQILNLLIGKNSGGTFFQGAMDDVRFFERHLYPDEIQEVRKMGRKLVAYYSFDNHLQDQVSLNYAVNQGATPAADRRLRPNRAYHFDGTNHIELPMTAPDTGNEFTVSLWTLKEDGCDSCNIMQKGDGTTHQFRFNSRMAFNIHPSEIRYTSTSASVPDDNQWNYYTIISRKPDDYPSGKYRRLDIYRNGKRIGYSGYLYSAEPDVADNTSHKFLVGKGFKGVIDNVRVYNYALNADQVRELYGRERNATAVFPLDSFTSGKATSVVGSSYIYKNGYLTVQSGVQGNGVKNIGNNTGMEIRDIDWDLEDQAEVSFWFKDNGQTSRNTIFNIDGTMEVRYGNGNIQFSVAGRQGSNTLVYTGNGYYPTKDTWSQFVARINQKPNTMSLHVNGYKIIERDFQGLIKKGTKGCLLGNCVSGGEIIKGEIDNLVVSNSFTRDQGLDTTRSPQSRAVRYPLFQTKNTNFSNTAFYGMTQDVAQKGNPAEITNHLGGSDGQAHRFKSGNALLFPDTPLDFRRNELTYSSHFRLPTDDCTRAALLYYGEARNDGAGQVLRVDAEGYCSTDSSSQNASSKISLVLNGHPTRFDVYLATADKLNDNQWHHVVVTVKEHKVYIFLDDMATPKLTGDYKGDLEKIDLPIGIGGWFSRYSSTKTFFDISHARLYDHALTQSQRESL